jgi:hypothetical protein
MIVMMMAMTPSLNASSLFASIIQVLATIQPNFHHASAATRRRLGRAEVTPQATRLRGTRR